MRIRRVAITAALAVLMVVPCLAIPSVTVTETSDGTIDDATWRVAPQDEIVPSGGHPDGYLRVEIDAADPQISTVPGALQFLENYRSKGVISLGVDVSLFDVGIAADGRPVSLFLYSNMGTPSDPSDDCEAVLVGSKNVPRPGTGWKTFEFRVPSQSLVLPQNWIVYGTCADLPPDEAWNRVITTVGRASFRFGEPGFAYPFQIWSIGFDNPRITLGKRGTPPTVIAVDP